MPRSASSPSSSKTQVPLLLQRRLRDTVLSGAAEIVVEHGVRHRCFLHIHSEEERMAAVEALAALTGREDVAVLRAHERWLKELRWARAVFWGDHRIRRFVRHESFLVWPAQVHLDGVAALVRQLVLCDDEGGAAALRKANDIARASEILAREATQPGLHLLTDSALPGQAVLYKVEQTRKRERDAAAPSMPSVLSRVDESVVENSAWIAELKQPLYALAEVLQLQFAATPLKRLVELLQGPHLSLSSSSVGSASALAVRQQWKALIEQHRAWAEYGSLFADVAETCRSWGASEACVAREVNAAVEGGRNVHLRTGVYMSVVQRSSMVLLLTTRSRKLESLTAAEQQAIEAAMPAHSSAQCLEDGLVRFAQPPANGTAPAALEATIRQLFLSPALSSVPLRDCCTVSAPLSIGADLQLVTLSAPFNPFIVVHGSRVDGGFAGDVPYYQSLQRERDRLVERRAEEELRHGFAEAPSRAGTVAAASAGGSSDKATSSTAPAPTKRQPASSTATVSANTSYFFKRSLVSALAMAPLSKAEIQRHSSMQQFRGEANFDALLNATLKEVAEYKGQRYRLRS